MTEVALKKKITLRRKNDSVAFNFSGKLKVKLLWQSATDLDLCLFFKKKDGEVGGVFSNEYRNKKSDLGSLDCFPYILHMGDQKEPTSGGEESEQINIANLSEIETAYILIVNYGAAIDGRDVTYAQEGGRIEVQSDSGDYLEVLADAQEEGHVYCVCSIHNNETDFSLKNESRVMDLSIAYNDIPGFSLICE